MSIALLTQVHDEMRRLAIAGSLVAPGDFRLQKLVAPLQQAGAKAPVFAKVAEAVQAVVDSKELTSARALLDLTVLVNAILYTQGETGCAGDLAPIETSDLGTTTTQASARVLKPLLEALTNTGSGRLEMIRDAHERGAFRDLRLVKPALGALDDGYAEIADLVAEKILPLYGKAIYPELQRTLDLKGRGGHPRRLQLMHALDPAAARDHVKQALETGSKEVKIVAIACLGPDDLSYLIEQAGAKAQEVRQAAYHALAGIEHNDAVAVLNKAMTGKDLELASAALHKSRSGKLLGLLIAAAQEELAALAKVKDKKDAGPKITRSVTLLNCLTGREDPETEAFLLSVFGRRAELAKVKGDTASGADLNSAVVRIMAQGTKKLQTALVDAHADLPPDDLRACFSAARAALPAVKVYDTFAPYLTAKVDEKKKQRDPAWARREAILDALGQRHHYYYWSAPDADEGPPLDPRWLDRAVEMQHLELVRHLIRPGHAAANAFLKERFDETFKKSKQLHDCIEVLAALIAARHAEATDAAVAVLEKFGKKGDYYGYWLNGVLADLPKSAVPRLEALIPTLNDKVADTLLGAIQQLRDKKEP